MTIEGMLIRHGFLPIYRSDAPDAIHQSAEFQRLFPASAVLLRGRLT